MGYPDLAKEQLIAGLFPRATRVIDRDVALALDDRAKAIEQRARELAEIAVERGETWVQEFGTAPENSDAYDRWISLVAVGVAYREHWSVHGSKVPFGGYIVPNAQATHESRVTGAARQARASNEPLSTNQVIVFEGSPEQFITAPSQILEIDF